MDHYYSINFKKIGFDDAGYLVPIEAERNIPFAFKRIYYLFQVPVGVKRGLHSHKTLEQVLLCLHGKVTIRVAVGDKEAIFELDDPTKGLYIGPSVWREMTDFQNAVLLVLASDYYDEADYIRNYDQYLRYIESEGLK